MTIVKRFVVPAGGTRPTQEEWFDTEKGRVVPAPKQSAPEAKPAKKEKHK
jgi:hypothetical protein